jgi:hypothetical protein
MELRPIREALVRSPTKAELALYANAEKRLAGTPHFSSTRATQQVQIAHVALLLSAPTQVIFSSPIAHLRAMRAIRFGLLGAGGSVVGTSAKALAGTMFVFDPLKHWNHWHVQYTVEDGSGPDPVPAVARFEDFLPLWAQLGIDLAPLVTYLSNLALSPGGHPQIKRASDERDKLLEKLKKYKPQKTGRDQLRNLFLRFTRSDPDGLLKPANAVKLSVPLQALADESEGVIAKIKTRDLVIKFLEAIDELELILRGASTPEAPD